MDYADTLLWTLLIVGVVVAVAAWRLENPRRVEGFITLGGSVAGLNLSDMTTQALDSAPTTSEVKDHYKKLLVFADADIRKQGVKGLRILADFRDRLYGPRNFRDNLTVDDFMGNWPDWLAPIDPTIKEPVPEAAEAVTAEARMLAYLQKNYPQEDQVDEQTGSTIRNMIEDFGYRFVFKQGEETVQLRPDFLVQPLLKNWTNPAARA
jgi:hypothetical protein